MTYVLPRKQLIFTVTHEEVHNIEVGGPPGIMRTTWTREARAFEWAITRPEIGAATFKRKCDYCDKEFEVTVKSLSKIASDREAKQKFGKVLRITTPSLVLFGVLGVLCINFILDSGWLYWITGLAFVLAFISGLMWLETVPLSTDDIQGYQTSLRERRHVPVSQHYISNIKHL
jgi:hypothetical protein